MNEEFLEPLLTKALGRSVCQDEVEAARIIWAELGHIEEEVGRLLHLQCNDSDGCVTRDHSDARFCAIAIMLGGLTGQLIGELKSEDATVQALASSGGILMAGINSIRENRSLPALSFQEVSRMLELADVPKREKPKRRKIRRKSR